MKPNKNTLGFILLFILVAIVSHKKVLWRFDNLIYDTQINYFSTPASEQVVIIGIDEKSLNFLGRWPWRRKIHAELLDKLSKVNSKAIGLNIIFSEPDHIHPNDDELLAKAIDNNGRVVLPIIFEQGELSLKTTLPLTKFSTKALALGHANVEKGQDGISRNVFLKASLNGAMYPSIALAMYALEVPEILLAPPGKKFPLNTDNSDENVYQGDYKVWLPFYKSSSGFKHYSYIDVLSGAIPMIYFKDKYILIGLTASGMESNVAMPITVNNNRSTGVSFIASTLDALIKQRVWQPLAEPWQLLITACIILLKVKIYKISSLTKTMLFFLLLFFLIVVFSVIFLRLTNYWFAPSALLFAMLISFPLWSWQRLENIIFALFTERKRSIITLDSIGDGVITTSLDGNIEYLNPEARKMIGTSKAKIIGKHIDDMIKFDNLFNTNNLGPIIKYCIGHNNPFEFTQCTFTNLLNKGFIVNLKINPLYDQNNQHIGSVLTLHDVKKIVMMADQLIENVKEQAQLTIKKEKAEQANQAKSQFLSHMSHELRTPLNAIIGYSELMQMDFSEDPQAKDKLVYVDEVLKGASHLLDLINELLDLSIIEAQKIELDIKEFEIINVIDDCLALALPLAEKRKITIINLIDRSCNLSVSADPKRVKQIILNFISNAIKYNHIGGEVRLYAETRDNAKLRVSVVDSGIGLTAQQQAKLFQSYERLDANKTEIEGTGFGLFISKQYAEEMGGAVGVNSNGNEGSTFWVEFILNH